MDILERFENNAKHQVLKYAAGKQIFCPAKGCGRILDYKKTVLIEFEFPSKKNPEEKKQASLIICKDCFDSEPVQKQMVRFKEYVKEVTQYKPNK
jgi:hypothetical protein